MTPSLKVSITRLTAHIELLNTLTDSQLGTNPDTQTNDAIHSLFAIIQHNKCTLDNPTYVAFVDYSAAYPAFVDYSAAYPSVHRDGLSFTLLKNDIRGNMRYHLRARFDKIKLRALHPGIPAHNTVDILRGLPKGIRLSPTLFGKFVADLVHELRAKFSQKEPNSLFAVIQFGRRLESYMYMATTPDF